MEASFCRQIFAENAKLSTFLIVFVLMQYGDDCKHIQKARKFKLEEIRLICF